MKIKSYIPAIGKEKIKTDNKIDFIEIYYGEKPDIWIDFYRHSTDEDFNYKELVKSICCSEIPKEHSHKILAKIHKRLEETFNVPVTFTDL